MTAVQALLLVRYADPVITSNGGGPTATVDVTIPSQAVTTVVATPGPPSVVYSIAGGTDAGLFAINSSSGGLTFVDPSVEGDYDVIVRASNGSGHDDQELTVAAAAVYIAPAVHFDGSVYLSTDSLIGPVTPDTFSYSGWLKPALQDNAQTIFVTDPDNNYTNNLSVRNRLSGTASAATLFLCTPDNAKILAVADFQSPPSSPLDDGIWHHVCAMGNTTDGTGSVFIDGVLQANGNTVVDTPFEMVVNGLKMVFGGDTFDPNFVGDLSDWWVAPGVYVDFSQPSNIEMFRSVDGKPVNPSGFPSSAILFSGDADTFGTNQGTGGAFTLTGALTNASTSPSDDPYIAQAVHFDGATEVHTVSAMAGVTNSPRFLYSMWTTNVIYQGDFATNYPDANWTIIPFNSVITPPHLTVAAEAYNSMGSPVLTDARTDFEFDDVETWHNVVYSVDTTNPDPNKQVQVFVDGVSAILWNADQGGGDGAIDYEGQFFFAADGYGSFGSFDAADVQVWFGIAPDLSVSGVIDNFISGGKPVNPSTAAIAFGQQAILFSGDHTSFGVNQGSAGVTAVTGTLTNTSTSPSD